MATKSTFNSSNFINAFITLFVGRISLTAIGKEFMSFYHINSPKKNCKAATTTLFIVDVQADAITFTVRASTHTLYK